MSIAASQIFDFLERQEIYTVERCEVASASFGQLRRGLRQIVLKLRDSDDRVALEVSDRLRTLLSEWLTVPVTFDRSIFDNVATFLGQADAVQNRWGADIRLLYDIVLRALEDLPSSENPIRQRFRSTIRELRSQGRTFKIYCHRRAQSHFESILVPPENPPLSETDFLHSLRDYRETSPFDVLIKIGPLRPYGWGSAPDALLTAPRFSTLVQIVWSGCGNDASFGYDPVSSPNEGQPAAAQGSESGPVGWTTRSTRLGEDPYDAEIYTPESDELAVFKEVNSQQEKRRAKLIQIDEEHGILYPPHSQVLSFDPNTATDESVDLRIPGEKLFEGMFIIIPVLDDVELGGLQAEHGYYSKIWKTRLEIEWKADPSGLIGRLRNNGLDLVYLDYAIRHWCKPPSTVIHAPQQLEHFKILLAVLGIDGHDENNKQNTRIPFYKLAWNEVRRSRGEAIHAGFQEQESVEEHLMTILRSLLPEIRQKAVASVGFNLAIPAVSGIKGFLLFFLRVQGIEEGFSAPGTELKVVRELDLIDQWRD